MELLTLALAKGRTTSASLSVLEQAGIHFPNFHADSRKLIFYDASGKIKLIFVKAVDVPTYVEKGAADIGIVGKDNILEAQADIYEMLDLEHGQCKVAVAGRPTESGQILKQPLTVASKYPAIAKKHFQKKGQSVETIKLNGSVELAPLIGLADVIVDIVETGTTLKENGLTIMEEIEEISTRLIVNKASFATKSENIQTMIQQLQGALEEVKA